MGAFAVGIQGWALPGDGEVWDGGMGGWGAKYTVHRMSDMQTAMDLLGNALKQLEELKPLCVDMTMPYAERVQKREDEIEALKNALCILDTDNVEFNCKVMEANSKPTPNELMYEYINDRTCELITK